MAKIVAKRYVGTMPVFNMEVYKHHNYVTPYGSVLHNCRYFCISRSLKAEEPKENRRQKFEDSLEKEENYETFMCGGEPTEDYLAS